MKVSKFMLSIGVVLLFACTTTPLTEEEKEWRWQTDAENWLMCELVYKNSNAPTIHYDHRHRSDGTVYHMNKQAAIRLDLMMNMCRLYLKDYWIEY